MAFGGAHPALPLPAPTQVGATAAAMAVWAYSIAMLDEILPRDPEPQYFPEEE